MRLRAACCVACPAARAGPGGLVVPHTVTPTIVTGKTELGFRRWDGIGQDMVCTTRFVLWVLMTSTQAGACRRRLHSRM